MSWHLNLSDGKKDQDVRSRKLCVCGGHNARNVKKNLHHNSTRNRHNIRKLRRMKETLWRNHQIEPSKQD